MISPISPRARPLRSAQSGIALIVALIVLVAMTLASIGMVRSVDTSVMIAGNMAFRQGATVAGDAGVEAARTWLMGAANLTNDDVAHGYYATSQDMLDLTGNHTPGDTSDDVSWDGGAGISNPLCLATDTAGNTVCYIVHRLCQAAGPLDPSTCSTSPKQTAMGGSSKGGIRPMETYQERNWTEAASNLGFYRVTVRIAGPRNNISFIQTFLII